MVSKDLSIERCPAQVSDLFGRVLGSVVSLQLEKITKVEHSLCLFPLAILIRENTNKKKLLGDGRI